MLQSCLFAVVFWFVLLPTLWVSGSLARFPLRNNSPLFSGILTLGLGLGAYAYFFTLAGSLNCLKSEVVLGFFAAVLILRFRTAVKVFAWAKEMSRFWLDGRDFFSRTCQISLLVTGGFTAIFCFLPEIANDSLAIHLYVAKLFSQRSSVSPLFYDIASYRPLLMSVLYSTGLLFQNVAIAKLFHWFCGCLLVSAAAVKLQEATASKKVTLFFAAMLWLTPTLMNQMATTYIDAGATLFVFLGYCVVIDAFEDFDAAHFFYGGLLIGLAIAIRHLSFGAVFVIGIMLAVRMFRRDIRKKVFKALSCFGLGVFFSASYWFFRDWFFSGNPFFPFLGAFFDKGDGSLFSSLYFHGMGLPRTPMTFLSIPWDVTFQPDIFDYHHWIGPFYLLILPAVIFAAVKIKSARPHVLFAFLLTVFWYFTGQNIRYLMPAFPVYLLAGAMGMSELAATLGKKKWVRTGTYAGAFLLLTFLLALTTRHFRYHFMPVLRQWSLSQFLIRMERSSSIAEWINKNLPLGSKILVLNEVHLYYFNREVVLEGDFAARTHYDRQKAPEAAIAILKEKGITHVLDAAEIAGVIQTNAPDESGRFLRDPRFSKTLVSLRSMNVLGKQYLYTLRKLV